MEIPRKPPPPPPPPKPKVDPAHGNPLSLRGTPEGNAPVARNSPVGFSGQSEFNASLRPPVVLSADAADRSGGGAEKPTARRAQEIYDQSLEKTVQKPLSEWNATDAADFNEALADQVEANQDDPALVRSLMTLSAQRLERSAQIVGQATEGNDYVDGDVERLTKALSRTGNASPDDVAERLAYGIADKIPEDSEQNKVDDGFGHYVDDDGGDPHFRDLIAGALASQGKDEAADELINKGAGGVLDTLGHYVDAFTDLGKDIGGSAFDFGGDVFGAVVDGGSRIIGAAGDFAVDAAKGTIDFAGDVASLTKEAVEEGVKFAVEKGLELAGPLLEKARGAIQGAVLDTLNIDEKVDSLKPGDSLSIGGSVDATLGVHVGASADLQVKANEDGTYTVSGEVHADLGVKLLGGAAVGGGGKVEFTFANKEEATKAAESLALAGASAAVAATPPFGAVAPLLLPSGDDLSRLANNVSAVELSADVAASVDGELGLGDVNAGAEAGVTAAAKYRLELDHGKPVALVREQEIQGTASGDLASDLVSKSGISSQLDLASAEATGTFTVSTRIPLPDNLGNVSDVLQAGAFIADVSGGLSKLLPNAETSISGSLDVSAGGSPRVGAEVNVDIPDVELTDGFRIAADLARGRFSSALKDLPDTTITGNTYQQDGFQESGGIEVAGQGISLDLHNVVKHVQKPFEVNLFEG